MAANINPIYPNSPVIGIATLTSATPVTSRANIAGTTGLTQLTPTSVEGKRVDALSVKCKGTSLAGQIGVWLYNGTTSFLLQEIEVEAVTASTTTPSFEASVSVSLTLPPTYQLFISQTVASDLTVFAHGGDY